MSTQQAAPRRGTVPHSISHEQSVLAMVLIDWETCWAEGLHNVLSPDDFFDKAHGLIYEAAIALRSCDDPCPVPMVAYVLQQTGVIDEVDRLLGMGVEPYLVMLEAHYYTATAVLVFARVVKEYAEQRRQMEYGAQLVKEAYEGKVSDWRSDPRYRDEVS